MNRTKILAALGIAVLLFAVVESVSISQARAEGVRHSTPDDLFYNNYVPPVGPGSVGAAMYPCPRPAPALVGRTYVTYQPLMPQEFLYMHHRVYRTFHDDAPKTTTHVHWW